MATKIWTGNTLYTTPCGGYRAEFTNGAGSGFAWKVDEDGDGIPLGRIRVRVNTEGDAFESDIIAAISETEFPDYDE
ncbi:hypothetical protein DWF04_015330 [Cereibacter sphaeroides f. sp. denitrificans]|nr:hypothetical protein DWF04_16585 [Cereibacter sphaeroides f. sp. denitrificans]